MSQGKKVALLVGVSSYGEGLEPLQCPTNGVEALQGVLKDPTIGDFDQVISLIDPDVGSFRARMGEVFSRLKKNDLALFYFTGHGIKDSMGNFYLTTAQTQLFSNQELNRGTAIEAAFVKGEIQRCYAQRKVIILDCCFGAAFAEGFLAMDDGSVDVQGDLGGEGWVVLTAATARNYALEQEGEPLSVYTRYLVEGLKTGAAASEGTGYISVRALHEYVRSKVQTAAPSMNPTIFNAKQGDNITLAKVTLNDPELQFRKAVERYIEVESARISLVGKKYLKNLAYRLNLKSQQVKTIVAEALRPYQERNKSLREYETVYRDVLNHYQGLPDRPQRELRELQRLLNLRDEDVAKIHARVPMPTAQPTLPPASASLSSLPTSQIPSSSSTSTPIPTPSTSAPPVSTPTPTLSTSTPSTLINSNAPTKLPSPALLNLSASLRRYSNFHLNRKQFLTWVGFGSGGIVLTMAARPLISALTQGVSQDVTPKFPEPDINFENIPSAPINKTLEVATFEVVTVNGTAEIDRRRTIEAQYFTEELDDNLGLEMMAIPGGTFTMGSPVDERGRIVDEGPQRRVIIPPFFCGRYTVTQAQYEAVMENEPRESIADNANRPIVDISWHQATAFCNALSRLTSRIYRLPTEAEWEYACRAGTETPYYFGPTITPSLANYNDNTVNGNREQATTEVGKFPPNEFGLYDMHGNVWEWCRDVWHPDYQDAPNNGHAWLEGGDQDRRVLRGGSWNYLPKDCRSAKRLSDHPDRFYSYFGFRVVCDAPDSV